MRNKKIVFGCQQISFPLLFFAYQFVVILLPNLIADVIMQKIAIGASGFRAITGAYYLGIGLFNIPAALLLERYSIGRVIGISSAMCGLLLIVFYNVTDWYTALCLRFLIGVASSVGFIAVSKTALQYFPNDAYSFVMSCSFTICLFVSFLSSGPLCFLMETYGTLRIINVLAFLGILISVGALTLSRSAKMWTSDFAWKPKIKTVLLSKKMMLLCLSNMLAMGLGKAFLDLWGVSYLVDAKRYR